MAGDPRVAGQVRRWHTQTVVQSQTLAEHQWNTARVLLAIWPAATREVLLFALFHDLGEQVTGDLPYPVKANNPALKSATAGLESSWYRGMIIPWNLPPLPAISYNEAWTLKMAEMLECWEFLLQETVMGNRLALPYLDKVAEWLQHQIDEMQMDGQQGWAADVCEQVKYYMARRRVTWQLQ